MKIYEFEKSQDWRNIKDMDEFATRAVEKVFEDKTAQINDKKTALDALRNFPPIQSINPKDSTEIIREGRENSDP